MKTNSALFRIVGEPGQNGIETTVTVSNMGVTTLTGLTVTPPSVNFGGINIRTALGGTTLTPNGPIVANFTFNVSGNDLFALVDNRL